MPNIIRMSDRTGIILLVSGPSGSGKTTLCRRLADEKEVHYSTSCTTRPPREGEKDGHDYHFLERGDFSRRVATGDFLEHAEVHENQYGTLKSEVLTPIATGKDVVMDIDVQGAAQVRACPDHDIRQALVDLFVMPPSKDELRRRLTGRGTDPQAVIDLRMENALQEMTHAPEYRYLLLSGAHEDDYCKFKSLLIAQRLQTSRLTEMS